MINTQTMLMKVIQRFVDDPALYHIQTKAELIEPNTIRVRAMLSTGEQIEETHVCPGEWTKLELGHLADTFDMSIRNAHKAIRDEITHWRREKPRLHLVQ